MKCYEFTDPAAFYEKVAPNLLEDEVVNNLPLGILKAITSQSKDVSFKQPPFLAYVGEENSPELILLMTPPNNLILSGTEAQLEKTVPVVVDYLTDQNIPVPGVIGAVKLAEYFKKVYIQKTGALAKVEMSQRIYKLEQVNPIRMSPGHLRPSTYDDVQTIADWILAFDEEAMNGEMEQAYAIERAERGVKFQTIYMWEDGGKAVSMANKGRATENGTIVNLVYTPNDFRGKGYASSCVAALSQLILDEGKAFCSLYTDLANPTSNSIYQKIGYQPITDSVVYRFSLPELS